MSEIDAANVPAGTPERRRAPRLPLVARGKAANRSTAGTGAFEVMTANVSEGGLLLKANHEGVLEVNDVLTMSFPRPTDQAPIEYKVRVAWVNRPYRRERGAWWTFGGSFLQQSPDSVLHLLVRAHRNSGQSMKEIGQA